MDYYTNLAPSYDRLHGEEQRKKIRIIQAELEPCITPATTLLDVGCGTGISLEPWKCKKTGIEPSKDLAAIAKSKGLPVIIGTAESLPFGDHCFDIVISVTAAHHFTEKGFEEMKRVGKDIFVFSIMQRGQAATLSNIKRHFIITKEVYDEVDIILFCKRFT